MKKLLTIIFTFLSFNLLAQPILEEENFPELYEEYKGVLSHIRSNVTNDTVTYNPGPAGANVVWDYSYLPNQLSGDTVPYFYDLPSNAESYNSGFANAEVVIENTYGDLYFAGTASDYSLVGMHATYDQVTTTVPYDNPQKIAVFPMNYGDSFDDTAKANNGHYEYQGMSPTDYNRTIYSTSEIDGYGTLHLPNASYNNVLRLKVTSEVIDSVANPLGGYLVQTNTSEEYYWFDEQHKHQLLYMNRINVFTGDVFETIVYFKDPRSLVLSLPGENAKVAVKIFPNPASETINITAPEGTQVDEIIFTDLSGRVVLRRTVETESMDISVLEAGIYSYSLYSKNKVIQSGKVRVR